MFQQAFGFAELAPKPKASAQPLGPLVPGLERLFPNSARGAKLRARLVLLAPSFEGSLEELAPLHTASYTRPQPSATKNPSPSRSTGCASRPAHPCNDAVPAGPYTAAPHRNTPCTWTPATGPSPGRTAR